MRTASGRPRYRESCYRFRQLTGEPAIAIVRRYVLAVAAIVLTGCAPDLAHRPVALRPPYNTLPPAPASAIEKGRPVLLTAQQQEAVVVAILSWMKDPASARFGDMRAARNSRDWITVCGEVDGSNSAGRQSGSAPFIGVLAGTAQAPEFVVVEIGGAARDRAIVEDLCRESGIAR